MKKKKIEKQKSNQDGENFFYFYLSPSRKCIIKLFFYRAKLIANAIKMLSVNVEFIKKSIIN